MTLRSALAGGKLGAVGLDVLRAERILRIAMANIARVLRGDAPLDLVLLLSTS